MEEAQYLASFEDPVEAELAEEAAAQIDMEGYYAHRYTYPTGNFDGRWLVEARQQMIDSPKGIPAGRVTYDPDAVNSPLTLDPTQFTSLGPKPLQSDGCASCYNYGIVAGRANDALFHPTDPSIAYVASDGGGVWKTTNCCSVDTVWEAVSDAVDIPNIAIGDLEMDPNNPDVIYAGTGDLRFGSYSFGSYGLLKTSDGGTTWDVKGEDVFTMIYPPALAGGFPQYQAIGQVEVDPANSDTVVVGTKTGVHFSYDGGETWTEACRTNPFDSQRHDVTAMLIKPNATGGPSELVVGIGTRGTVTQVQQDLDQNGANGIYMTAMPTSGCPAVGDWQLVSRPDNGWPAYTGSGNPANGTNPNPLGRIDMAFAPSNPSVMYAQVQAVFGNTHGQLGIWRTTDNGATWTKMSGPDQLGAFSCGDDYTQNWYDQGIAVSPTDPNLIFFDTIDLWRSTDGGATPIDISCGYTGGDVIHVDHHEVTFYPNNPDYLLAVSDGGIYFTDKATQANLQDTDFVQMNNTLPTIEFYSGDITANFATAAEPGINAGAQDNGSSVRVWNSGMPMADQWQVRNGGDGMYALIEPMQEERWYQESQNGNIRVSVSGPFGSLLPITGGWSGDRRGFIFPYTMYKWDCPSGTCEKLIAGSYRVWESITGGIPGSSWYVNSPDLTKGTLEDRSIINQLAHSFTDSTIAIVGTNDGNVQYGFNLNSGTANTATWVNVTGGNTVLPNRPILDVVTHATTPTIGYAAVGGFDQNTPATPGHVFEVTCNADCSSFTWANKSGNLPNIPVDSIMVNPNYPVQVFAGTDWGLYFTNDISAAEPEWFHFTAGVPNVMIWDMTVDMGYTTLALFTRSRGAYAWPLPSEPIPTSVTLSDLSTSGSATPWLLLSLAGLTSIAALAWVGKRRRQQQ